MPIDTILSSVRNSEMTCETDIRNRYSTELIQDKINFSYTDPADAPIGSLEKRIQELFFRLSSSITSIQIDIDDGII